MTKEYDLASDILKKGMSINPYFSKFYYLAGVLYKFVNKNLDESRKNFDKFCNSSDGSILLGWKFILLEWKRILLKSEYLKWEHLNMKTTIRDKKKLLEDLEKFIKENKFFLHAYIKFIQLSKEFNIFLEKQNYYKKELLKTYPFLREIDLTNYNLDEIIKKEH